MNFYIYFRMRSEKNRRFSKIYFRTTMTIVKFLIRLHLFLCKSKTKKEQQVYFINRTTDSQARWTTTWETADHSSPLPSSSCYSLLSSVYSPFRGDSILSCFLKVAGTSIQILSAGPDQTQKVLVVVLP